MKIAVVTDTGSGISKKEAEKMGITVVPIPFLIDEEDYIEDVNLTQEQFYEKLIGGSDVSTSQPNLDEREKVWTALLKTHDAVVDIPLSSGLSASCENLTALSEKFKGKVQVVNNKRISVTQVESVKDALKLVNEGKTAQEIKEYLEETSLKASIYIMVTTLKYLKKGGRITPAAAAIGTLLKIKPILQIQGDKLDKFCQVINYQQGKKKMIEQIMKDIDNRFQKELQEKKLVIAMAHTHCEDKVKEFEAEANEALKKYDLKVELINPLSLPIACHIGEGSIAITCCIKR